MRTMGVDVLGKPATPTALSRAPCWGLKKGIGHRAGW